MSSRYSGGGASGIEQYVQQLPLLSLAFLPLISAIFGLKYVNLKSVIHFQQGTLGSSPWRAATTMTFLSTPIFFVWCLCVPSPSAIFFQLGASLALLLTTLTSSPILHYLPSPSISMYYQLRFLSKPLRSIITMTQCVLLSTISIILLFLSASFLSTITNLSIYLLLPLVAYFSLFSVIFSGHSSMMTASFFLYIVVSISGIGIFLYYAVQDVQSFGTLVPVENFRVSDILSSLMVGFTVNFYLLNSSFQYQIYSPMPTMHKLRLTLTFYGVFQLFISIFIFLSATIFLNFLREHCKFAMSFGSFFQFTKAILGNRIQVFCVCASLLCILSFCFQWTVMSLMTLTWEEYWVKKLRAWNPIQQLCSLQFGMLILTTTVVVLTVATNLARIPIGLQLPTIVYVLFSLFAIISGVTICGYYLPFCSATGAISSFMLTIILTAGNLTIYLMNNSPQKFQNSCILEDAVGNSTAVTRTISLDRIVYFVSHLPPQSQPIITLMLFVIICTIVSFLTGGQDQMGLDWNLIAFTWATSVRSPSSFSKRQFVVAADTEDFRYAQQQNNPTPSPDVNAYR
ncbi:hypothetical protein CAEBREN_04129 [Caenorhabditis brenneri]|uniref:Uncharacterized protein n=1 Tax=Caenorhabditis brenneri TaxID=135651 RepID=G0NR69_CAEBE|nr:hypothetical protein CAEBREN_04129 [Caenorhabditis brenneri]